MEFRKNIQPILKEFCYDCHADGANKGNVAFDEFKSDAAMLQDHDLWWKALKNLRADGALAREQALARAEEQLAQGEDPQQVLRRLAHQLTNRLLHAPTTVLRQAALNGDSELLRAAERLYKKDDDSQPAP